MTDIISYYKYILSDYNEREANQLLYIKTVLPIMIYLRIILLK